MKKKFSFFSLERIWPYLKQYKGRFILVITLIILGSIIDLLLPLFQRYAINTFIAGETLDGLVQFILLYAGTTVVQIAVGTWYCYISFQNELLVGRDLKRVTFNHLQTQSLDYFSHDSVGYLMARVMSDTDRIGQLISWGLIDGIWTVIYLIGAFSIMAFLNLRLTLWVAIKEARLRRVGLRPQVSSAPSC